MNQEKFIKELEESKRFSTKEGDFIQWLSDQEDYTDSYGGTRLIRFIKQPFHSQLGWLLAFLRSENLYVEILFY